MGDTIDMAAVMALARARQLRLRAFGETAIFGEQIVFGGDSDQALTTLADGLARGIFRMYRDCDGLFVGPANPDMVEGGAYVDE